MDARVRRRRAGGPLHAVVSRPAAGGDLFFVAQQPPEIVRTLLQAWGIGRDKAHEEGLPAPARRTPSKDIAESLVRSRSPRLKPEGYEARSHEAKRSMRLYRDLGAFGLQARRLERDAVPAAVQVVHRLHREQDEEVHLGALLRDASAAGSARWRASASTPSTWSIVYWYSPVQLATMRRTSLRTRAMKRAAFMFVACAGSSENSLRRSRS